MGVLEVTRNSDDPIGTQHLELEVDIAWADHELGICQAAQDNVVGALEVDHLEGEGLDPVFLWVAKHNLHCDLAQGPGALFRYDLVECGAAGKKLGI